MVYNAEPHAPIDHGSTGRIMAAVAFQGRSPCITSPLTYPLKDTNMTSTDTLTETHELSVRYCFACKNYGSSMVQFFKDDIDKLASKLIRLGVSEEALTEIYNQHVG